MKITRAIIAVAAMSMASGAQAATIFGIDELNNLVTIDSANAAATLSSTRITGVADSIKALDFRSTNNVLYGLGGDKIVYTINTLTGAATAVSSVLAISGTEFGFDFNPTIDRLRIVSNTNENYVFNPNDGSLTTATSVFYAAGDRNAGRDADVTALAYTSSTLGAAPGTTQLYGIDTALGVLVRQANSAGTLETVGNVNAELGSRTSFDIAGSDAFAVNGRRLYSVNLGSGSLTQVGLADRALFGIAISSVVPEPAGWAMMLVGFGAIGVAMRRRPRVRIAFA